MSGLGWLAEDAFFSGTQCRLGLLYVLTGKHCIDSKEGNGSWRAVHSQNPIPSQKCGFGMSFLSPSSSTTHASLKAIRLV